MHHEALTLLNNEFTKALFSGGSLVHRAASTANYSGENTANYSGEIADYFSREITSPIKMFSTLFPFWKTTTKYLDFEESISIFVVIDIIKGGSQKISFWNKLYFLNHRQWFYL